MDLALNNLLWLMCDKIKPKSKKTDVKYDYGIMNSNDESSSSSSSSSCRAGSTDIPDPLSPLLPILQ